MMNSKKKLDAYVIIISSYFLLPLIYVRIEKKRRKQDDRTIRCK